MFIYEKIASSISLLGAITVVFMLGTLSVTSTATAADKVDVCHGENTLNVSPAAALNFVMNHVGDHFGACERERYGTDNTTKRMIDIYSPCDLESLLQASGLTEPDNVTPIIVPECTTGSTTKFNLLAVSGTLEEGFPLRGNLDFMEGSETVLAIFLGHALIRGLRAKLDIKSDGWREFVPLPGLQNVNPALVTTENANDANISSIYAIDRRQAVRALLNEPRFLSMTPDSPFIDRNASETTTSVKNIISNQIAADNTPTVIFTDTDRATILTVITVWDSCHLVPSPVLYVKSDGTRVTDFPNSLAAFAGVTDALRTSNPAAYAAAVEDALRDAQDETADCDT